MKKIILYTLLIFFMNLLSAQADTELENPIKLPKAEGSKNFDLEISMINQKEYISLNQNYLVRRENHLRGQNLWPSNFGTLALE